MNTPNHLGGHAGIVHIDIGAMNWAIKTLGIKTARDIGCGPGHQVKLMLDAGIDAYGIEGDPDLNWGRPDRFIRHDYTLDTLNIAEGVDLGWCVEMLEHIEEEYLPNVFSTFRDCEFVIVTAAPPGTEDAHHHVNCKDQEYWINKFHTFGFDFAPDLTADLREASTMERNFMRETGMVFVRNLELDEEVVVNKEVESVEMDNPFTKTDDETENSRKSDETVDSCIEKMQKDKVAPRITIPVMADGTFCHPITKDPLPENKSLIEEDDRLYIVTLNKNGSIRKGSMKLIELDD